MINKMLSVGIVGLLFFVGCGREGSYPTFPDPYKEPHPKLVVDRPGENIEYHNEFLGSHDWVEMNRNNDISIADRDKKASCYEECIEENNRRREVFLRLRAARKYVRENCTATGGSTVIASTSEDSPTAHNRIVESETTGKLEYRERTIHVVIVRPKNQGWKCPSGTDEFTLEVSSKWMGALPAGLSQKYCESIKTPMFTGISLDVCQKWVKED